MNRLSAVGLLMIGGAFVNQGTATVRLGGGRSADLLPLALAVAGLRSAGLVVLVRCRARNGQRRVPVRALSIVKRSLAGDASARRALLNALAWAHGKEIS
jgi:hypothetical protein